MLIFSNIKNYKNQIAIITENNEKIKYIKLLEYVEKFTSNIQRERQLVFLICQNNLESIVSYLSFIKKNCIISLIDERIDKKFLEKLVFTYKPDYIYLPKNKFMLSSNYSSHFTFYSYELLKSKNEKKKNFNDNLTLLISTSGSTGTSKLVRLSYDNLNSNIQSIIQFLPIREDDITITTLPMSYVYGLSIINTHLYKGACITLNNRSLVNKFFWQAMQKHKVTSFGGVPYTYTMLDKIGLENFSLNHLRYTTQAGGRLNEKILNKTIQTYKKQDIKLILMYGAAEATARMSYLPWSDIERKLGSIGKPIPQGEFYIRDEEDNKINESDKEGELVYKGKNVCMGYAQNIDDLNLGDENKGILNTGDIAFRDKDGFYFLLGRKDRFIKIYGMRINLQEIEDLVLNRGAESMCLQNEENRITILVKNYDKLDDLKEYISKLTNIHPSVFTIKKIKDFPLTNNYKLSYRTN